MAAYRVIVKIPSTGDIWEVYPKTYGFTEEVSVEPNADFTFSFEEMEALFAMAGTTVAFVFTAALRQIWIEKQDPSGNWVKIYDGVISSYGVRPSGDGERSISIKSCGWFGLLQKRTAGIPKAQYTATDAGAIAWDLIDDSQNSDTPYSNSWGITMGVIQTSVNRDRTFRFDSVKDAIQKLTNRNLKNGFDCEIDTLRRFNVYYPKKGIDRFNIVLDDQNLANWDYKKDLVLSIANKVHVVGEGTNDDVIYTTRSAAAGYKTDFGLLEDISTERDVKEIATLQDKGDKYLELKQSPPVTFSADHYDLDISILDYNLGDSLKVNMPDLGLNNTTFRVMKRNWSMDSEKSIGYVKLTLQ